MAWRLLSIEERWFILLRLAFRTSPSKMLSLLRQEMAPLQSTTHSLSLRKVSCLSLSCFLHFSRQSEMNFLMEWSTRVLLVCLTGWLSQKNVSQQRCTAGCTRGFRKQQQNIPSSILVEKLFIFSAASFMGRSSNSRLVIGIWMNFLLFKFIMMKRLNCWSQWSLAVVWARKISGASRHGQFLLTSSSSNTF